MYVHVSAYVHSCIITYVHMQLQVRIYIAHITQLNTLHNTPTYKLLYIDKIKYMLYTIQLHTT